MATTPASVLRDHWYWRPGWARGTRFYTWHLVVGGRPEVRRMAAHFRPTLAQQPVLDVVPFDWLHVTVQGVGFVHQVDRNEVDAIVAGARVSCGRLAAMTLKIGEPSVHRESVQCALEPAKLVCRLRDALRSAIADVRGAEQVPDQTDGFHPHLSLAYVNAAGPAAPIVEALKAIPPRSAPLVVDACQLIVLNRDQRVYMWEPVAEVAFGERAELEF